VFHSCVDARSIMSNLSSEIFDAFNRFVLLRNSHYPHKVRRLCCRKSTAWKKSRTFRTQELLAKYKSIDSKCRSAISSHHVDVENKLISFDDINKSYRYTNRKFTNRSPIGPLKSNDGSILIDPTRKAQLLQTIFTAMLTTDNGQLHLLLIHAGAMSYSHL